MPLYEYKCNTCGQVFEMMQRFSDAPLTQHETCGGAVARLLSAPALQFKGSGWYITDYAKGGSGAPKTGNGSAADSKSEGKSETKSETPKSDAKKSDAKTGSGSSGASKPSTGSDTAR